MYEDGRLSPFVGESRIKTVDGLVALYERVVQEGQPIWVSLEAPSGWGKTRVGREFYSRLAARQEAPAYWPPRIDNPDLGRKAVHPPRFDSPEKSLPEFFWWGIACSTRSGRPTDALSQDLRQVHAHGDYLEAQWRALVSFHERHFPSLAEAGKALRSIGLAGALARGVEEAAEVVTPGLRIITRVGRWIGTEAKKSRDVREIVNRASHYDDSEALDIVDDTVDLLARISKPGLPIVVLVEDIHAADGMLIEFIGKLLERRRPIFVITTAWPDQINQNSDLVDLLDGHSHHLHRIYHTGSAGPPFPSDAGLGILEPDARAKILRHHYPRVEAESHWVRWRLGLLVSNQCTVGLSASVGLFELCGRYVAEVAVEALGVVPVHPGERGEFDVVDAAPRAPGGAADEFGLVEAVDGLGEGVDAPIGQVLVCGGGWRWWWSVMTRW